METNVQIVDLCYLSDTMPDLPKMVIPRDNYIKALEEYLTDKSVVFLDADEGTGVTTTLALFAVQHNYTCVTYFNNGLVSYLLDPNFIEQSLIRQLFFYIDGKTILSDEDSSKIDLKSLYLKLRRKIRSSKQPLYFIFDGFDRVPQQSRDNIRMFMESLPWDMCKFIFSGNYENMKEYLPKKIKCAPDQILQKFSRYEVISFLKDIQAGLNDNEYEALYKISGCLGSQLQIMYFLFKKHNSFIPILKLEDSQANDLYAYNFKMIEESENHENSIKVLATIAFVGIRLSSKDVCQILSINLNQLNDALKTCSDYLILRDNYICFSSESNQRFVQKKLSKLRHEIELLFIQQFKDKDSNPEIYSYMPSLLKSMNDKKGLVEYLNSEVVLKDIEHRQSQAALNEQCELGFSSSSLSDISQTSNVFRFAINKSASREIEQNELWDFQIDALLSVKQFDKAYFLALSVYLKEERLKALLLIARKKNEVPQTIIDGVHSNISSLINEIQFEHIPDKSMELAKLMIPYDYKAAVNIIERIAKVSKNRQPIDNFYSLLSIGYGQEKEMDPNSQYDVFTAKIEDDELKRMTKAVRNIFKQTDVDGILAELKNLPSIQQGLYLLQFWIPGHSSTEGIGKLVIYAIRSVISISNIEIPKVSIINDFCSALPNLEPTEIDQVIVMLDSFQSSILSPSEEYVKLELKVVEALFTFDSSRACEHLENLYLKVDDFKNKSTSVACKSIILGKYDSFGHKKMLEDTLMPSFELQKEIENEIKDLFSKTAYHLKIAETPIKSLVVNYRSSVYSIIEKINTHERRSTAYKIAADSYIHKVKPNDWDWPFLTELIHKIDYDLNDRSRVVYSLTKEIVHEKKINEDILNNIKIYHQLFFEVNNASDKCNILSNLYVLFKRVSENDTFANLIKRELSRCWDTIDLQWIKMDVGFLVAKNLAKVSVEDAKKWVENVNSIQESYYMASSSCFTAYQESRDLYTRTVGILIQSDLADDNVLREYNDFMNEFESEGERIISWSKIALYYYLKKDFNKFEELFTNQISKDLNNYSDFYKKFIIYNAAPAFYLGSKSHFYALLSKLDNNFKDVCISRVAKFIFVKYVELDDSEGYKEGYELVNKDFEMLIDLIDHCDNDNTFFCIFDCVCQSLKKSRIGVSQDQKQHFISLLKQMAETRLPMKNSIQHDGYKVACRISLSQIETNPQNQALFDDWENQILNINNVADQAFLYVFAAHHINKTEKRHQFISKASALIKKIPSTYDQSNRLSYCIEECRKSATGLTKDIVNQFMEIMCSDSDGNVSDVKRAYDCIYDYSPEMADIFLERMDTDPARNYYKTQLNLYSERTKKIASAKNGINEIEHLSQKEQKLYFSRQLGNQVNQKSTIYDIVDTMGILTLIYNNPISEIHDALRYFLENLCRKQKLSKNLGNLIQGIYEASLFNLKLVLSLSSGSKEKLKRVGQYINDSNYTNSSLILSGDRDKAIDKIISWYTRYPFETLFIIDAYFSPEDFHIIKSLMNVNNNLSVTIITHRKNVHELDDYQRGWDNVSSDLTGAISIHTICFENDVTDGPLHDRWWVCVSEEEDKKVGLSMNSISGLGKKDSGISDIEEDKIEDIEKLAMSYAVGKRKKVNDVKLIYESIIIR